jgi:hypothetical protein
MSGLQGGCGDRTIDEVGPNAGNATRFSGSARSNDRLAASTLAASTIYDCPNPPAGRSWLRNRRESGECRLRFRRRWHEAIPGFASGWRLGFDDRSVVGYRPSDAEGDHRRRSRRAEASRIVTEKIEAGLALQAKAMTGTLGTTPLGATSRTIADDQRKVKANRRRLTGSLR